MNDAADACCADGTVKRRGWAESDGKEEFLSKGGVPLSGDVPLLQGEFGRADVGMLSWPEPYCQPFRKWLTRGSTHSRGRGVRSSFEPQAPFVRTSIWSLSSIWAATCLFH